VSAEALAGAGLVTLVPIWIAAILLSRQPRPVFWFACALIMVGAGYLIATGAAEDVGRSAARFLSDRARQNDDQMRAATCSGAHMVMLGALFILLPFLLPLAIFVMIRFWHRPALFALTAVLAGPLVMVCLLLVAATPIPERLARSVLPEKALKVPAHCAEPKS
jgi:hypothetical protein